MRQKVRQRCSTGPLSVLYLTAPFFRKFLQKPHLKQNNEDFHFFKKGLSIRRLRVRVPSGEIGLNINFFIDDSEKYEDDGHYEIYYVPTNNKKFKQQLSKEKRNRIIILHNCTDTIEIRNLAAWLEEQANAIDEEKEIIEKETG